MPYFNWYIDREAIPFSSPPFWDIDYSDPKHGNIICRDAWSHCDPWLLNEPGKTQDGQHRWTCYGEPVGESIPVITIPLSQGWDPHNVTMIARYLCNPIRKQVLDHDRAILVINYSLEGFGPEVFLDFHRLVSTIGINPKKLIYVSGSMNIDGLYERWCVANGISEDSRFRTAYDLCWMRSFSNGPDLEAIEKLKLPLSVELTNKHPRYVCLNRRLHLHRMLLLTMLEESGSISQGMVSMPATISEDSHRSRDFLDEWYRYRNMAISDPELRQRLDESAVRLYRSLPLSADGADLNINLCLDLNPGLAAAPLSIITETHFFNELIFPSEKIWKPMAYGQAFIPVAARGYLIELKNLGFGIFDQTIPVEFDYVYDHIERMTMISNIIKRYSSMPENIYKSLSTSWKEDAEKNRKMICNRKLIRELSVRNLRKAIENDQ